MSPSAINQAKTALRKSVARSSSGSVEIGRRPRAMRSIVPSYFAEEGRSRTEQKSSSAFPPVAAICSDQISQSGNSSRNASKASSNVAPVRKQVGRFGLSFRELNLFIGSLVRLIQEIPNPLFDFPGMSRIRVGESCFSGRRCGFSSFGHASMWLHRTHGDAFSISWPGVGAVIAAPRDWAAVARMTVASGGYHGSPRSLGPEKIKQDQIETNSHR